MVVEAELCKEKTKRKREKEKESGKRREKEAMDLDFFLPHSNDTMRNLFLFHVNDKRRLGLKRFEWLKIRNS